MRLLKYPLLIVVLLMWSACREKVLPADFVSEPSASPSFVISDLGDTIPVGLPIPLQEHHIIQEPLPDPDTTPAKVLQTIKAPDNIYTTYQVQTIPIDQDKLNIITPGAGAWEVPRSFFLKKTKKQASFPLPKAVGDLRSKDLATYDIRYLDVTQGLSTSYIWAVHPDQKGFIWFSMASEGVCRYDGRLTTCFTESEGLISNKIYEIIEDRHHNLWFAGRDGVSKFDGHIFTNFALEDPQNAVLSIFEDDLGIIWWGTVNKGVLRYDPARDEITQYRDSSLFEGATYSINQDQKGRLWFGGSYGAYVYQEEKFTHFTKESGLVSPAVTSTAEDEQGRIWMTTAEGVSIYDGSSFQNQLFPAGDKKPYFHFVYKDSRGHIWLPTKRQGLFRFDGQYYYHYGEPEGLRYNEVIELKEDSRGQLWAATFGGGLNKLNVNSFQYLSTTEGLLHSFVDDVVADEDGQLWIANENLIKYDGTSFYYYDNSSGLPDMRVHCLAKDKHHNIWLGLNNGISRYDGKNFTYFALPVFNTIQILTAQNGDLWLAGESGLVRFNPQDSILFKIKEALPFRVNNMTEDPQGNIWLSSETVLTRYDGAAMTHFLINRTVRSQYISCSYADRESNIWLGTNHGLYCYRDGRIFPIFPEEPLSQAAISGIQEDKKGNIWVSFEKGLLRLWKDENLPSGYGVETFYGNEELKIQGFTGAICLDEANHLWLGSTKGLTTLDLDNFYQVQEAYVPRVYLDHIQLNETYIDFSNAVNQQITEQFGREKISFDAPPPFSSYPTNLVVPHDINHLTFTYTGIDWKSANRLRYQYLLTGLDKNWSQTTTENKVEYRNISPGKYTFMVRAKSDHGDWSPPLSYAFTVRPPWWLTWGAYSGYALIFCGLAYVFFLFLKSRLQLQNQLRYEQAEAQRLKELDTFKTRLYTNLTHEFRTPLTVILGMVKQLQESPKSNFAMATQLIERNGKNLLRLINQLLDLSRLENKAFQLDLQQGDLVHYLRYLTESFQTYANSYNLALRFSSALEPQVLDYDSEQIKQVMTNLISNAVKFTSPGGVIQVSLFRRKKTFIIEVKDTGIGIAKKDLPHIFDRFYQVDDSSTRKGEGTGIGLAHTRELVHLMGGTIGVDSQENRGTTFTIVLPITQNGPLATNPETPISADLPTMVEIASRELIMPTKATERSGLPQLLIIEDNYDVVIYLQACLENSYQIEIAYNGKIGTEQALRHIPDLIICDVMMPEKNGYEVCDILKNDERTSHIPIILLTAKADAPSRIEGFRRGADAYLAKPFQKEELLVRLQTLVEKQQKLTAYFQNKWRGSTFVSPNPEASLEEAARVEDAFLQKLTDILEVNYQNDQFGLKELCQEVSMSRSQLFRKMKALFQVVPSEFIRSFRLKKAKYLLENTDLNVNEVTWKTGFTNPTHFSRIYKEEFGITPSKSNK